jgi:hypothetical protein
MIFLKLKKKRTIYLISSVFLNLEIIIIIFIINLKNINSTKYLFRPTGRMSSDLNCALSSMDMAFATSKQFNFL